MYRPTARSSIVTIIARTGSATVRSEFCVLTGDVGGVEEIVCCVIAPGRVMCVEGIVVGTVVGDDEFAPIAYRFLSLLPT
jgi:hypothetical protein